MSIEHCEMEEAVLRSVQSGQWTDDLQAHAAICPVCSDVVLVAGFLQQEAETMVDELPLPEPELVWWRAQLLTRQEAARRATRSITIVQTVSWMCGTALALALLLWTAPVLGRAVSKLLPTSLLSTATTGVAQPGLVLIISAVAIIFLALFDHGSDLVNE